MKGQKKSKIPYIFFVFFAVIFAVNFFYIYISQKTWRGLATDDAYQKGLHYNQILEAEKKQKELGWKMAIYYRNLGENKGVLEIDLKDKNSQKISDAEIEVNFKRPTQEGKDFSQKLKFRDGFFKADIFFPLKGQWDFEIRAVRGEDVFRETDRNIIQ